SPPGTRSRSRERSVLAPPYSKILCCPAPRRGHCPSRPLSAGESKGGVRELQAEWVQFLDREQERPAFPFPASARFSPSGLPQGASMSEVKLLPLPKVLLNVNIEAAAYARANVEHAVAPLQ